MKEVKTSIFVLLFAFTTLNATAQKSTPRYLNASLTTEQRVDDIISKLSLSQKVKLLMHRGTGVDSNGLKIPAYNWWNECLHGVARAGKATVFPQAIGMAAMWDTVLMNRIAVAISDEARAKHTYFAKNGQRGIYTGLNFWTPNINIFRDPRWGRGMETYGEDPLLTTRMASAFIKGLQGNNPKYFKTIATIKHYIVHSGPEEGRSGFNAEVSDRDLYETYAPAFKASIQNTGVYSLMCAYNAFRSEPCCSNDFLMNDLLRKQWGFKGFIVTDCGAVSNIYRKGAHEKVPTAEEASARAIKAGVDLECGAAFNALDKAVEKNLITEAELDNALRRLFTARFRLGFFDDDKANPFTKIPYSVVESKEHVALSLEAARKSVVLLKNDGNLLPLKKSIKTLAVVGPNAADEDVQLANYHGFPSDIVSPLEGLRKALPGTKIIFAQGSAHAENLPVLSILPSKHLFADAAKTQGGLKGEYFTNRDFNGTPVAVRRDAQLHFNWINAAPLPALSPFNYSIRWTGFVVAPTDGDYFLDVWGSDYEVYFRNEKLMDFSSEHAPEHRYKKVRFKAGEAAPIRIDCKSFGANNVMHLSWEKLGTDYESEAVRATNEADAVVVFAGLSPRMEGEEMDVALEGFNKGDRVKIGLPAVQSSLIKKLVATGKPVVLVLVNGSAVAINWEAENVPAIVESWYGGQQAGTAIADVLTGKHNPSGRLPVTFYTSEKELPKFDDYNMKGRTYRYYTGKPLFEFGYGLSYTYFAYTNLKAPGTIAVGKPVTVSVQVQNTGGVDGEEVVQLYLKNNNGDKENPLHTLKGFARIALKKGEKKTVTFTLRPEDFSHINAAGERVAMAGAFEIAIGGKQPTLYAPGTVVMQPISLTGATQSFQR